VCWRTAKALCWRPFPPPIRCLFCFLLVNELILFFLRNKHIYKRLSTKVADHFLRVRVDQRFGLLLPHARQFPSITHIYFCDKDSMIMHDYEMHDAQQCMITYDYQRRKMEIQI
jgi:hypothetical protein